MSHDWSTQLDTAPTEEPITRDDAKQQLEYADSDRDDFICTLITAARMFVEKQTGRQLLTATWKLFVDQFPCGGIGYWWKGDEFRLPFPPLSSVSSIKYVDNDGVTQTLATSEYTVDANAVPGRIALAWSKSWPSTRPIINAVTVEFVAGYGAAGTVPDDLIHAMKIMLTEMFEARRVYNDRRLMELKTAKALWYPYKVPRIAA